MVRAANDVRDAHVDVVDHRTELIHGLAVVFLTFTGAQQNKIFNVVVGKFAIAENSVLNFGGAAERDFEAHRGFRAGRRGFPVATGAARDAADLRALRGLAGFRRMVATGIFFRGAIAQEGAAVRQKFQRGFAIKRGALRLVKRSFVPIDAQPGERGDDAFNEFRLVALGVSVLNAQDHFAAIVGSFASSVKPVEQRGARSAHVQVAGGRWRKTYADFRFGLICNGLAHLSGAISLQRNQLV